MKTSRFLNFAQKPFFISFRVLVILLVCAVSFSSCKDDDDEDEPEPVEEVPTQNIAEIVIEGENFTALEAALIQAELVGTFQGTEKHTVFAPTDAAFTAFLSDLGVTLEDVSKEQLTNILLQHVVTGEVRSTDLTNGSVTTLNPDAPITVDLSNGVKISNATVTTADIEATNGIIHVIDAVIQ